jgi:RNA-directed DNA polymerase
VALIVAGGPPAALAARAATTTIPTVFVDWIEYYGRYAPSALYPLLRYINLTLRDWVMRKFKRFAASKSRAGCVLKRLARENANLFVHWRIGMAGTFA